MPIPEDPEPESPTMHLRMLEFVERRREEQARARRQRIQLIALTGLGIIGIVLAVSNAVLVSRLVAVIHHPLDRLRCRFGGLPWRQGHSDLTPSVSGSCPR